ncbi:MAG: hypothetical protein O2893_06370 [Cyanobacteria bacterium]|nr:hypothetical protein [Cyanobacteriota bacterium]
MLLQQGAAALKLWTGLPQMPLKQMGNAVEQALDQQKP